MSRRVTVIAAVVALVAVGCGGGAKRAASTTSTTAGALATVAGGHDVGVGVLVAGSRLPAGLNAVIAPGSAPPAEGGLSVLSSSVELSPSGPLPASVTVTIPLLAAAPSGEAVFVESKETAAGPWTYMQGQLSPDRKAVSFTTTRFSIFSVLGYLTGSIASVFKTDFVDVLDGGVTVTATKPSCSSQAPVTQAGYTITSSTTHTLYWCAGLDGAMPVLKVVNTLRYPLEVAHPGLMVANGGHIDYGQWSSLAHWASGSYTIVAPGGEVDYTVNIPPGDVGGVSTQLDGLGQSLYALQTGVTTLLEILTKFGLGSGTREVDAANTIFGDSACVAAVPKGPIALLATCLDPKELLDAFGKAGIFLVPLMVVGPVVAFFQGEFAALVSQFNDHDRYTARITHAATPPATTTPAATPIPVSALPYTCGTVTDPHNGPVDVTILSGSGVTCATALKVVTDYFNLPLSAFLGNGGAAPVDGWSCGPTPNVDEPGHDGLCAVGFNADTPTISIDLAPPSPAAACTVSALASAFAARSRSVGSPFASVIVKHDCFFGWAFATFSPPNQPQIGGNIEYEDVGAGVWKIVGVGTDGQDFHPLPPDWVQQQLLNRLEAAPIDNFPVPS
jgi:hypothetical protein